MIAERTTTRNELLVTEADFDRLKHLLESPRYRVTHAMLIPTLREGLQRCRVVEPESVPKGVVTMHTTRKSWCSRRRRGGSTARWNRASRTAGRRQARVLPSSGRTA